MTAPADGAPAPIEVAARKALPLGEAQRRWAELLRRIYEADPLACPACGGAMRILAFITEGAVIDRILAHLRRAASPPARRGPHGYPFYPCGHSVGYTIVKYTRPTIRCPCAIRLT